MSLRQLNSLTKVVYDSLSHNVSFEGGHVPRPSIFSRKRFEIVDCRFSSIESIYVTSSFDEEENLIVDDLIIFSADHFTKLSVTISTQKELSFDKLPLAKYATSSPKLAWHHIGRNVVPVSLDLLYPTGSQYGGVALLCIGEKVVIPAGDCLNIQRVLSVDVTHDNEGISSIAILIQGNIDDVKRTNHKNAFDSSFIEASFYDGSTDIGDDADDASVLAGDDFPENSLSLPNIYPFKNRYYVVFVNVIDGVLNVKKIVPLESVVIIDQIPCDIIQLTTDSAIIYGSNSLLISVCIDENIESVDGTLLQSLVIDSTIPSNLENISHAIDANIICVNFNSESSTLGTGDDKGIICSWRLSSDGHFKLFSYPFCPESEMRMERIVVAPSGKHIAVSYADRLLLLSTYNALQPIPMFQLQNEKSILYVRSILDTFENFRSTYNISFGEDSIRVWRITNGINFEKQSEIQNNHPIAKNRMNKENVTMYGLDAKLVISGICVTTWNHRNLDLFDHRYPANFITEFDENKFPESPCGDIDISCPSSPHLFASTKSSPRMTPSVPSSVFNSPEKISCFDNVYSPLSSQKKLKSSVDMISSKIKSSHASKKIYPSQSESLVQSNSRNYEISERESTPIAMTEEIDAESKENSSRFLFAPSPNNSVSPFNDIGIFRTWNMNNAIVSWQEFTMPKPTPTNQLRSTSNLDDIMFMPTSVGRLIPNDQIENHLMTRGESTYTNFDNVTDLSPLLISMSEYHDPEDRPDVSANFLDFMRNIFGHDMSESFLRVKNFFAVYCAAFRNPSIGLISAALDIEPFVLMNLVEETHLSQIFDISREIPQSFSDDLLLQDHLFLLKPWLISTHRVCKEFWIDSSVGHNYLCALHLKYCGNKSVSVECIWHEYLRIHGPSHLRQCSRGLRLMTQAIRKIDETVGIKDSLPPQIGFISGLQEIYARRLGLKGRLPNELGQLSHLRVLSMGNNKLCGELPESLGNLKNLQRIVLHQNALTGRVPDVLGQLGCIVNLAGNIGLEPGLEVPSSQIEALYDLYNSTSGNKWNTKTNWLSSKPVCTWYKVGVLSSNVHSIVMSSNGMEGTIPASIGKLTQLRMIELASMTGQPNS